MIPLVYIDKNKWVTVDVYHITENLRVPKGFETDLTSVPRIFWSIYPPFGKYQTAAIVHDYLYRCTDLPKLECDYYFYQEMKKAGVSLFTRFLFYSLVLVFGRRVL